MLQDRYFVLKNGRAILDEEISIKMAKIAQAQPEKSTQSDYMAYEWDEKGLASLFAECYNHDTRYCPDAKAWYCYDTGVWKIDKEALLVAGKIKEFIRILTLYAADIADEDTRKAYQKFLFKASDRRFRDRIAKDAAEELRISINLFDAHPNLINCLNGTYDLDTFTFRKHDPKDLLTMQTNFQYGLHPTSYKRWEQFIDEVTSRDREKADFLQRSLGYSLLGTNREECMFILYGKTTRNGKSTMLDAIEHLLGTYATVTRVELITSSARNADAPTSALAKLKGKRFVTMAESDSTGKLDEAAIKQYTGGEEITARELYQSAFTFKPQFTLWLSCNDLPRVHDKSLFASDRLKVIEFTRHFNPEEQDKTLKETFATQEAMYGIFTWLVTGYKKYLKEHLTMPKSVRAATAEYALDNDIVQQFLEDKTMQSANATSSKTLYDAYKSWCKRYGYFVCSLKKFTAEVTAHTDFYKQRRTGKARTTVFEGIELITESVGKGIKLAD